MEKSLTGEDKKNINYISQLLKQIRKDKQEYAKVKLKIDEEMDNRDKLRILLKAATKINGHQEEYDRILYTLGEINYRHLGKQSWVKYQETMRQEERLQGLNNSQKYAFGLHQEMCKQNYEDTDEPGQTVKSSKITNSKVFNKFKQKMDNRQLNFSDNLYLRQLACRSKKVYENKEREKNPGEVVPAPVNPNGGVISNFRYANTNDTLPKSTSILQFNKEIDERKQYQLNNPNASSRKRTFDQTFGDIPDTYQERDNYRSLSSVVENPDFQKKRDRKISDSSSSGSESEEEEDKQMDISRFIKKSEFSPPNISTEKPTEVFSKNKEVMKKTQQDDSYKVVKTNIYEKIICEDKPDRPGMNLPHFDKSLPPENLYNPSSKRERKRAKYSDEDDDKYYRQTKTDPRKSNSGDSYLDRANSGTGFATAERQFHHNMVKKYGNNYQKPERRGCNNPYNDEEEESATAKMRKNGGRQPGLGKNRRFTPPDKSNEGPWNPGKSIVNSMGGSAQKGGKENEYNFLKVDENGIPDERYQTLDPRMVEIIESEILESRHRIVWNDIAGLESAKKTINELITLPLKRPDIFKGIRAPPKGVLLFGPPGTGKTMIGKAIASETNFTFFNISASALTSKWVGEGEKLVKTLFKLSVIHQPSVIFIDEIDSLLCSRSDNENEAGRKIKTEFMVHLGGAGTDDDDKVLIIGATNRPFELDDAIRRRLEKRLYIPLPCMEGRRQFIERIIETETENMKVDINTQRIEEIATSTKGYSGADLKSLFKESAMIPIRELMSNHSIEDVSADALRPVVAEDILNSMKFTPPSVNQDDLSRYLDWNKKFGSYQLNDDELNT
ncbi:unnamed protein product [Moneuplotes crassus]|uniref:AAA+ ATPase domain-containing protein n=1 Tax=Euplotes crassus TaxID=5936 RepID=A0AAD1Y4Y0_EUPCR|nr:unnamed protein product [Moneuplotes crassus]